MRSGALTWTCCPQPLANGGDSLQPVLHHASDQVRRERAPHLHIDPRMPPRRLAEAIAQARQRWRPDTPGMGPGGQRSLHHRAPAQTLGAALQGRSFLHDYDAQRDPDGSLLEALMTAPMLVTHWINWQYHASTCAPTRLGSGTKVLHNVVGGSAWRL